MSLGEVLSARELVKELEKDGCEVIVSATTLAGLAMAKSNWPNKIVLPSPLDFSLSTRRFLEQTQPDQLILVETDLWPGILMEARKRNVINSLVSARLSPRSYKNYQRVRFFWSRVLKYFDHVVAQTPEDQEKLLALGANPAAVSVGGNLKFDQAPPEGGPEAKEKILAEVGWPDGRYLVAGSFHSGEDSMILEAFKGLRPQFPDLKLVLAPRDRHKFSSTFRLAQEAFPKEAARRSRPAPADREAAVFVLDTLGELEKFYAIADLALIGKSWPGHHEGGGHNPLEAAVRRRAVLAGPRVHNFKWIYSALAEVGAAAIVEKKDLPEKLSELLRDPARLSQMGEAGQRFVAQHRGTVRATLDLVRPKG
jgi:3-deoxy-D-manno-octulosonic-acid transferase